MPTKYYNKKVEYDGRKFDSIAERDRYKYLVLLQKAGEIRGLSCQQRFDLHTPQRNLFTEQIGKDIVKVCTYVADFVYEEIVYVDKMPSWVMVVEDVKGQRTAVYKLKKKWMKFEYGIDIREIVRGRVV